MKTTIQLVREMRSGAILVIPEDFSTLSIDGLLWEREEEGFDLKSLIQFERHFDFETGIRADEAIAIHQEIRSMPALREIAGRYTVQSDYNVITNFAFIHILSGFIVVDKLLSRKFVSQIINHGLGRRNFAEHVTLDTQRIANDHRDQWVRRFKDRTGRVNKGSLYGDGVERDSVFGPELIRSTTGSIGWFTNHFGSNDKVMVSPKGSVTVWANPPIHMFLKFIRDEILPYLILSV